jgi:Xaa-Pro dipeptidase
MINYRDRLRSLSKKLQDQAFDGCVLLPGSNFSYYTGISHFVDVLSTVLFLPAAGTTWESKPLLVLPAFERYTTEAAMPYDALYVPYDRTLEEYASAFRTAADTLGLKSARIGVDSTNLRFQELRLLQQAVPNAQFDAATDVLAEMRLCKAADEVEALRHAAEITEEALSATLELLHPGLSEKEIRNLLHIEMMRAGSDGLGFESIVVSGPRAALQHPIPSDRQIESGDCVLFDIGARYRGYTADITRTVVLSSPSSEFERIYAIVEEANAEARNAARPGVSASDVDAAARRVIDQTGYGETFIHGTGHGLGLDVHEPPVIAAGEATILQPGMVFTIEPGIYLHDQFGIRIEDDVVITETGHACLTSFTRDLVTV